MADSRSYWVLQRTPDTFPSYLNDIAQSMMEYVADISRERVRFRGNGYLPSQPVESARGSKDAFYIKIDKHYGASDHATYMQHGIPAVMFITWPDMWYHSTEDTPDKHDTTQSKRAAAVGLGSLQMVLDKGQQEDWFSSDLIVVFALVSFFTLSLLVINELNVEQPIINLRLFRDPTFATGTVVMFFLFFNLFGSIVLLPIYVQGLMGYSAYDAGLVLGPGGIATRRSRAP